MTDGPTFHIAVLAGDGIGPEVIDPCIELLEAAREATGGFALGYERLEAGAGAYLKSGTALSEETFERAAAADAILLGAMGMPDIRYPDGREIAPQLDLRERLELFAGLRPAKALPGVVLPLADPRAREIDFVIVRESTEGLFAGRGRSEPEGDDAVRDWMRITRKGSERLFDAAFALARARRETGRPGVVTCIDKANVIDGFAFFRKVFDERAAAHPDVEARHAYVDATALNLVRQPWSFDVLVTENMFGDILSDLAAGLVGGMGFAPSADVGDRHAVFQPCHGSAPDIAGQGKANPTATFLSGAMMLDWLGERHGCEPARDAGRRIERAVEKAFADGGLRPFEIGGSDGTAAITARVLERLSRGA